MDREVVAKRKLIEENPILCRYLDDHVLDTIRDRRLKVAVPSRFNDPFEFMFQCPETISEAEAHKLLALRSKTRDFELRLMLHTGLSKSRDLKKRLKERGGRMRKALRAEYPDSVEWAKNDAKKMADHHMRILCLSRPLPDPRDELLLWAHYTNGHRGARLHLDASQLSPRDAAVREMDYGEKRVEVPLCPGSPKHDEAITKSFYRKNTAWSYEQEVRIQYHTHRCPKIGDLWFVPLPPSALRRIDFGMKMPDETRDEIRALLQDLDFAHVEQRVAVPHESDFALKYEKL